MKTEEQAAQALATHSELQYALIPATEQKVSRWAFKAGNANFQADVAFRVKHTNAWLFAEPDDAARAPQNVAKYLMWIEENGIKDVVHLIHPIGPENNSAYELAYFLGSRMKSLHSTFFYHPFRVQDWHNNDWVAQLVEVARGIVRADSANERLVATGDLLCGSPTLHIEVQQKDK